MNIKLIFVRKNQVRGMQLIQNVALIKEFLRMADMDLKSSNILYEHHLYPQAMFYFSQSVEKANKAFALTTGQYTKDDMLDIRHDPTIIYKNLIIDTKRRYTKLSRDLDQLPDLKNTEFAINLDLPDKIESCDIELRKIAEIKNGKDDLIFISKQEIVDIVKKLENSEKEIKEEMSKIENFELTEEMWDEQKDELKKQLSIPNNKEFTSYIEKELANSNSTLKEMETAIKQMYLIVSYVLLVTEPLYHLAVITLPHSVITRYPQNRFYPTKKYTDRLAIVRNLPLLLNVQSKTLKYLEEYCKNYIF